MQFVLAVRTVECHLGLALLICKSICAIILIICEDDGKDGERSFVLSVRTVCGKLSCLIGRFNVICPS